MNPLTDLTDDNYHSPEANRALVSHSQVRAWQECPARWHAEFIAGTFVRTETEAMRAGSYVDRAMTMPATFEAWKAETPGILKKDGKPYAAFETAERMIAALRACPLAMEMLTGEGQRVFTARVCGVDLRCMVDVSNREQNRIVDLKTTADIHAQQYVPHDNRRGGFIEQWNYWQQMAMYRNVVAAHWGRVPDVFIVAADKREPCGVGVYHLNGSPAGERKLRECETEILQTLAEMQPYRTVGADMSGLRRCGACDYCRGQVVTAVMTWNDDDGWRQ